MNLVLANTQDKLALAKSISKTSALSKNGTTLRKAITTSTVYCLDLAEDHVSLALQASEWRDLVDAIRRLTRPNDGTYLVIAFFHENNLHAVAFYMAQDTAPYFRAFFPLIPGKDFFVAAKWETLFAKGHLGPQFTHAAAPSASNHYPAAAWLRVMLCIIEPLNNPIAWEDLKWVIQGLPQYGQTAPGPFLRKWYPSCLVGAKTKAAARDGLQQEADDLLPVQMQQLALNNIPAANASEEKKDHGPNPSQQQVASDGEGKDAEVAANPQESHANQVSANPDERKVEGAGASTEAKEASADWIGHPATQVAAVSGDQDATLLPEQTDEAASDPQVHPDDTEARRTKDAREDSEVEKDEEEEADPSSGSSSDEPDSERRMTRESV